MIALKYYNAQTVVSQQTINKQTAMQILTRLDH